MKDRKAGMLIVNFAHPLTPEQIAEIEVQTHLEVDVVRDVQAQFDDARSYGEQVEALAAELGISGKDWQTQPVLVILPGHSTIAAALLAVLHGHLGHFPTVARLARVPGPVTRFAIAEIINLQELREDNRKRRVTSDPNA